MSVRLDANEFVRDYCAGVKDKDLLAKYGLNAKQLVIAVKKLMAQGLITRNHAADRQKKIQELERQEENAFLKSLFMCPVCNHIQPTPFTVCPACGADVTEVMAGQDAAVADDTGRVTAPKVRQLEQMARAHTATTPAPSTEIIPSPAHVPPPEEPIPEALFKLIGAPLEDVALIPGRTAIESGAEYVISEVTENAPKSATLVAEDSSGRGLPLRVKLFHPEVFEGASLDDVVDRVFLYQSNMNDPNILPVVGTARLEGMRTLLHEYIPANLNQVLKGHPEGLPLDRILLWLPQILNGLGYSHTHRGRDGVVRRIPHLNLKPAKILIGDEGRTVKIDDAAVCAALIEVRGHKRFLWEEPGADLGALPPEAFLSKSRLINAFSADIYALGVLLYHMVTGLVPFLCKDVEEYKFAHIRKYPVPPRVHRYDIPLWLDEMILKCLEKEPANRWRSPTQMELAVKK
jgi:hypothetical protein